MGSRRREDRYVNTVSDDGSVNINFTEMAWESLYDAVDDSDFLDRDAQLIYNALKNRIRPISFGEYLKRYIYTHAGLTGSFDNIPLQEYQLIIKNSFAKRHTPPSFEPTTAKLSALSRNWLTQQAVKRKVVFLLGFGLGMSVKNVNLFLTKGLREQEMNPKDPFEMICWYCYRHGYGYPRFVQLWSSYCAMPPDGSDISPAYDAQTVVVRGYARSIDDDEALFSYLSTLKTADSISCGSRTAKIHFDRLYDEARDLIAQLYNQWEAAANAYEEQGLFKKLRGKKRVFTRADITESDIEHIIYSAIPKDRHGNLIPGKASKLNEQFAGKRLSRQRISEILSGRGEVNRFDLITLNFFIFSQRLDQYPNAKGRYMQFLQSINAILSDCFMGELYVQNPYECFILMCILSEDPLGTYADVWELSFTP